MKPLELLKSSVLGPDGKPSSMRMMTYFVVTQFSLVVTFGFIYTVFSYKDLIVAYAGVLVAAIMAALGIKAYQLGKETNNAAPTGKGTQRQGRFPWSAVR